MNSEGWCLPVGIAEQAARQPHPGPARNNLRSAGKVDKLSSHEIATSTSDLSSIKGNSKSGSGNESLSLYSEAPSPICWAQAHRPTPCRTSLADTKLCKLDMSSELTEASRTSAQQLDMLNDG